MEEEGRRKGLCIFKTGFLVFFKFKGENLDLMSSILMLKQFSSMPIQVMICFMEDLRFMGLVSWKNKIVEDEHEISSLRFNPVMTFAC